MSSMYATIFISPKSHGLLCLQVPHLGKLMIRKNLSGDELGNTDYFPAVVP